VVRLNLKATGDALEESRDEIKQLKDSFNAKMRASQEEESACVKKYIAQAILMKNGKLQLLEKEKKPPEDQTKSSKKLIQRLTNEKNTLECQIEDRDKSIQGLTQERDHLKDFNDALIESVPDFAKFHEDEKLGQELKHDYARLYDLALAKAREDFDAKIADQAAASKEKIKEEVAHATLAIRAEVRKEFEASLNVEREKVRIFQDLLAVYAEGEALG